MANITGFCLDTLGGSHASVYVSDTISAGCGVVTPNNYQARTINALCFTSRFGSFIPDNKYFFRAYVNDVLVASATVLGSVLNQNPGGSSWAPVVYFPSSFVYNVGDNIKLCYKMSECDFNSDCGPCEKCEDGECVPCEKCSDGFGELILYCWDPLNGDTVRQVPVNWSNPEILNVPLGGSGWAYSYRLTCPNGFEDGTITITEVWKIPPGIQTDPVVRSVNTPKGALYVDIQVADWLNKIDSVAVVPVPAYFSGTVHLGRVGDAYGTCSDGDIGSLPPDPVKPPPTEPPPTEPPDEPNGGDGPDGIDPPAPPDPVTGTGGGQPPLPPQEGTCECEKYLADTILAGLQQVRNSLVAHGNQIDARLADSDRVIFGRLTSLEKVLYQQLSETNRLLYQLSNWFGNNFFSEIRSINESVESISDDVSDIRDSLRLKPCEPDYPEGKTLAQMVDDFVNDYQPPLVEVLESEVIVNSDLDRITSRKI